jgi:PAS domain S-box-containing protein
MEIIAILLRIVAVFAFWVYLLAIGKEPRLRRGAGWGLLVAGFAFVLFGSLVDLGSKLPGMRDYFIYEHPDLRLFVQGVLGYFFGAGLIFAGFLKWTSVIRKYRKAGKAPEERREEELKKSEGKYRTLFEQASDGIALLNDRGVIRDVNPAMMDILGYGASELVGRHILDFIPAVDLEHLPDQWGKILTGEPQLFERSMKGKNGTVRVLEVSAKRLDEDLVQCLYRDVTERKRAEEALRKSESLYRSLFEDSAISLWLEDLSAVKLYMDELESGGVSDLRSFFSGHPEAVEKCRRDIKVVDINRKTLELLAAESRRQLLSSIPDILPPEEYPAFQEAMIALVKGKTFYRTEIDHLALNGERKHFIVQYNVVSGYEDSLERVVVSFDDITDREHAEKALRKSEERYRNIFENAPVGIFRTTVDGRYESVNPEGARMYGYDSPEDMMESVSDVGRQIYVRPERRRDLTRICREQGKLRGYEFEARRKDGGRMFVSVDARPILDEQGETIGFDGFNTDITLRKRAERELRNLSGKVLAAQEGERKRIGRELHDGPGQTLSALKILLERQLSILGERATDLDLSPLENTLSYIEEVIVEIRRILLDLRPAMLDDLGLVAAMKWLCQEFEARFRKIRLNTEIVIDENEVDEAGRVVLFRVLQEALNNVAKHSKADKAEVALIQHDEAIELSVKDNGVGFDVGKHMGGIGLAGMRERIEAISGSFEVRSAKDEGTAISINVPL